MEADGYIQTYNDLMSRVSDKDVAISILTNVAKDRRTVEINKNGGNGNGHSNGSAGEKATQGQLNYLKMLGIEAKANLSKAEASRLIDEAKMK